MIKINMKGRNNVHLKTNRLKDTIPTHQSVDEIVDFVVKNQ
jgi:hypothetical protein